MRTGFGCTMAVVRTILLLLFGSLLVALALSFFHRPSGQVLRGFDQIEIGMTEKEVWATIGLPPGDHRTSQFINLCDFIVAGRNAPTNSTWPCRREWVADNAAFAIDYDRHGKVERKYFQPVPLRMSEKLDHQGWTR